VARLAHDELRRDEQARHDERGWRARPGSFEDQERRAKLNDEWAVGATVTVTKRSLARAIALVDPQHAVSANTAAMWLKRAEDAEFVSATDHVHVPGGLARRYKIERAPVVTDAELDELLPTPEQVAAAEPLGGWLNLDWLA
jgi:hypothetical protein